MVFRGLYSVVVLLYHECLYGVHTLDIHRSLWKIGTKTSHITPISVVGVATSIAQWLEPWLSNSVVVGSSPVGDGHVPAMLRS